MKVRNKKTGEIREIKEILIDKMFTVNSLAELNEEWEDYEEPKEYWFVDSGGEVEEATYLTKNDKTSLRNFGNYFETKEEAEKAVEKLKAWKRLKDSGVSFEAKVIDGRWYLGPKAEPKPRTSKEIHDLFKDIMFVFGGEEWQL